MNRLPAHAIDSAATVSVYMVSIYDVAYSRVFALSSIVSERIAAQNEREL